MEHTVDIRVRLDIDEAEIEPGETPSDAAERIVREVLYLDEDESRTVEVHELVR